MKIYALRDRLIDYFMQPFIGPDDKNVQASVARLINQGEITSDIAQAPHHFEIWQLATIEQDGHIAPNKQFIADCASLVRHNPRTGPVTGADAPAHPEISRHRAPEDVGGPTGADPSPVPGTTPSAGAEAQARYKAASRGT